MSLVPKSEITRRLNNGLPDQIFIDPILSNSQVGEISIDLRLGCDFLVSIQTRKPSITLFKDDTFRDPAMFFQESRRDLGEGFVLYPAQTVLATTLEYVGLPGDLYADIVTRSSYNRLGITLNSMFQPGFRGCISLELFNHSNSPVELIVGSRIVQARFHVIAEDANYMGPDEPRKYVGHVRPTTSKAAEDSDIAVLREVCAKKR
jgi:dCTP deaminase